MGVVDQFITFQSLQQFFYTRSRQSLTSKALIACLKVSIQAPVYSRFFTCHYGWRIAPYSMDPRQIPKAAEEMSQPYFQHSPTPHVIEWRGRA
jgi:hypothetical protein